MATSYPGSPGSPGFPATPGSPAAGAPGDGSTPPSPGSRTWLYATLLVIGMFSLEFGSAFAALAIDAASAGVVVTLRMGLAGLILVVLLRPRVRGLAGTDWAWLGGLAATMGLMNLFFYLSIERIPLGAAVTFELVGPLILAAVRARTPRSVAFTAMAFGGVVMLGWSGLHDLTPTGVACALIAGAFWAGYILTTEGTGRRFTGQTGLALALIIGGIALAPIGLATAPTGFLDWRVLALGAVVAILSSIVPYGIDMAALRVLPAGLFATLTALAPATAAIAGLMVLGQDLALLSWLGIVVVVVAAGLALRESAVAA
ncbi:DMT family transporter [uncultured Corynebacterium sp.]|uniref:EamA family transporter n=1 Tax=uncultured Corynebacterium sp. TaxID=159447 RepID=UPI0025CF2167|nr:EamA family transporter [uncultured Corynebacterium sp.]